jgi:hypothetical protein
MVRITFDENHNGEITDQSKTLMSQDDDEQWTVRFNERQGTFSSLDISGTGIGFIATNLHWSLGKKKKNDR